MKKAGHQEHARRGHERRFGSPAERLRAPQRMALLEVPRVLDLCLAGISASRVLDVGTGTGVFAEAFAGRGLDVTGIDPNPGLLAVARRHSTGTFLKGTAEKLPFEDGSFDLVMMGHVLHETDDRIAALAEARRVARHRVAVLEWPYVEESAEYVDAEKQGPPLAHRLQSSEIFSLVRAAGFSDPRQITLAHMHLYLLAP